VREKACDCCSDVINLAMRAACEREKACDCCSDVIKLAMRAVCVRERMLVIVAAMLSS